MRYILSVFIGICFFNKAYCQTSSSLNKLQSPILFKGDVRTAYRDPAVLYYKNEFYLFFTLVKTEDFGRIYSYTAVSKSKDLKHWSLPKILTPRNQNLDYSSPGNIIRFKNQWVLCLQTYPRPNHLVSQGTRFGTGDARIFTMRSKDLKVWEPPQILKVKGNQVAEKDMGRMIDPYLVEDKDEPGKWWCFYKQNGVSMSYSYDLENWVYSGHTESGENTCVLVQNGEYLLLYSPANGMAFKRSADLKNWKDWGEPITLGQQQWSWARGRITGGTLVDLRNNSKFGKYIMFFHGSGPLTENEGDFDKNASIGIAWSDDLKNWHWPGKEK